MVMRSALTQEQIEKIDRVRFIANDVTASLPQADGTPEVYANGMGALSLAMAHFVLASVKKQMGGDVLTAEHMAKALQLASRVEFAVTKLVFSEGAKQVMEDRLKG